MTFKFHSFQQCIKISINLNNLSRIYGQKYKIYYSIEKKTDFRKFSITLLFRLYSRFKKIVEFDSNFTHKCVKILYLLAKNFSLLNQFRKH